MVTQSASSNPIVASSTARLLLRSSWGASLPANLPDSALDDEIAKILLKEAKEKEKRWLTSSEGVSAFLNRNESESKAGPLVTNKRFLKSVIREANEHNRSLSLRKDTEDYAADNYFERLRRRDPARLQQWDHRSSSPPPRSSNEVDLHHTVERTSKDSEKVRGVDLERLVLQGGRRLKGKDRARSPERDVDVNEKEETRRLRATKRRGNCDEREGELRRVCMKSPHDKFISLGTQATLLDRGLTSENSQSTHPSLASEDINPSSVPRPSSKMDKYFSPTYDPRLDISLDDLTDHTTGLIREGNHDDWEKVLSMLKDEKEQKRRAKQKKAEERRERKERRRRRREERSRKRREVKKADGQTGDECDGKWRRSRKNPKESDEELETKSRRSHRKRAKRLSSCSSSSEASDDEDTYQTTTHAQRTARKELGLMDIEGYAKKGKIREWDLGKENPT